MITQYDNSSAICDDLTLSKEGFGPRTRRLSLLIPVYNWDVSRLLSGIIEEVDGFGLWGGLELLILDDASDDKFISARNKAFFERVHRPYLKYSCLECNIGRSSIRNLLASRASGDFLIFMDCDVIPDENDFIRRYVCLAEEDSFDVVCGGISYRTRVLNDPEYDYHAYLGNKKEVKPASERNKMPWRHILTSNIMVRKSVFLQTPFDERFIGYGYEDIEWGVRLTEKFRILHIDNTVSHLGLVTKSSAYYKMCNSVSNYLLLKELRPKAYAVSALSKLVGPLARCSKSVLNLLDRSLKRLFLSCQDNRLAFLLFQLNFAVLLARSLKDRSQVETSG